LIVAFDTSALVKLVIPEEGIEIVDELWDRASLRVASVLAYPEALAALTAARRARRLTPARWHQATREFSFRWRELDAAAVDSRIAQLAGDLAREDAPLSGADAVHLATAMEASEEGAVLVTWDARLSKAARTAGLAVAP